MKAEMSREMMEFVHKALAAELDDEGLIDIKQVPHPDFLDAELTELISKWGEHYSASLLLAAAQCGASTVMRADGIPVGGRFEIPGCKTKHGTPERFRRVNISAFPKADEALSVMTERVWATNEHGGVTCMAGSVMVTPRVPFNVPSSVAFITPAEAAANCRREKGWQTVMDEIDAMVSEACQAAGHYHVDASYSVYEYDDDEIPINNLQEKATPGKAQFHYTRQSPAYKDYLSPVLDRPTWLEVVVLFNEAIPTVGDWHHHFLEGIRPLGQSDEDPDVTIYEFDTGS